MAMAVAVCTSEPFTVAPPTRSVVPAVMPVRLARLKPPAPPRVTAIEDAGAISTMEPEMAPPAPMVKVSVCTVASFAAVGTATDPAAPMLTEPPAPDSRLTEPPVEVTVPSTEISGLA